MLNILFFARLREEAGVASLQVPGLALPLPLAEVLARVRAHSPALAAALAPARPLRAALNQQMVALDAVDVLVQDGDELALFPPVTGG